VLPTLGPAGQVAGQSQVCGDRRARLRAGVRCSDLVRTGVSKSAAAKAYRLLCAVPITAVEEDKNLARNPCRIRGRRARTRATRVSAWEAARLRRIDELTCRF
jgi:hypothetical protein